MAGDADQLVIDFEGEKYYSAEAAAVYLGKKRAWVYAAANARDVPRYAFDFYGKRRFFRQRDLDAIKNSPPREIQPPHVDDPKADAA